MGQTAGGLLAGVGGAAKAVLGGLLGPFEREGAFDEGTAALTGDGACASNGDRAALGMARRCPCTLAQAHTRACTDTRPAPVTHTPHQAPGPGTLSPWVLSS